MVTIDGKPVAGSPVTLLAPRGESQRSLRSVGGALGSDGGTSGRGSYAIGCVTGGGGCSSVGAMPSTSRALSPDRRRVHSMVRPVSPRRPAAAVAARPITGLAQEPTCSAPSLAGSADGKSGTA